MWSSVLPRRIDSCKTWRPCTLWSQLNGRRWLFRPSLSLRWASRKGTGNLMPISLRTWISARVVLRGLFTTWPWALATFRVRNRAHSQVLMLQSIPWRPEWILVRTNKDPVFGIHITINSHHHYHKYLSQPKLNSPPLTILLPANQFPSSSSFFCFVLFCCTQGFVIAR
jgi:hypothetical protein